MTGLTLLAVEQIDGMVRYRLHTSRRRAFPPRFEHRLDEELVRELQAAAEGVLRSRANPSFPQHAQQRGSILYRTLVPKNLQRQLKRLSGPMLISIGPSLYGLPWEMLFDGEQFWGIRFAIGKAVDVTSNAERKTRPAAARRAGKPRVLIIGSNPRADLPFVNQEVERLHRALTDRAEVTCLNTPIATLINVTEHLNQSFDVIHYCGHIRPDNRNGSALVLSEERVLPAALIERNTSGAPLVFLNGCASMRGIVDAGVRRWEEAFHNVAYSFLLGGAKGVVGTLCDVSDDLAAGMANEFYDQVLSGQPVGEALRRARVASRNSHPASPTWLSFVLYGNPTEVLAFDQPSTPAPLLFRDDGTIVLEALEADALDALARARPEALGHSAEHISPIDLLIALIPSDAFKACLSLYGERAARIPPLLIKLLRNHVGSAGQAPVAPKSPSRHELERDTVELLQRASREAAGRTVTALDLLKTLVAMRLPEIEELFPACGVEPDRLFRSHDAGSPSASVPASGPSADATETTEPAAATPSDPAVAPGTPAFGGGRLFDAFGQLNPGTVSNDVSRALANAAADAKGAGDDTVDAHHLLAALAALPATQRLLGVPASDRDFSGRLARAAVYAVFGRACPERDAAVLPQRHQLSAQVLEILDAASAFVPITLPALFACVQRTLEPVVASAVGDGGSRIADELLKTLVASPSTAPLERARPAAPDRRSTIADRVSADHVAERASRSALARFGRDLVDEAERGHLAPLVGRDAELRQVALALARPEKSNVLLIGEAGVGKTAIVEGLAAAIALRTAPSHLADRRIIEIDSGRLVAGASLQGELEARVQAVLAEAEAHPETVLFLDEFHTFTSLGGHGDRTALTVGNQMKSALGRGRVSVIAATTEQEFALSVERDPALMRRFRIIRVAEPSPTDTIEILTRFKARMADRYGVAIDDAAIEAAVHLADRYLPGHRPDKARDLLVDACAARLIERSDAPGAVSRDDVARLVAAATGVPIEALARAAADTAPSLETRLARRIVGQDDAVHRVAGRLQAAQVLRDPRRPIAVLLFVGPTGVGKTEMARAVAEEYCGSAAALTTLAMNEYADRLSTSKLLGVGAGWIGHDEEPLLVGALKKRPRSVILLDEIDKAHPEVCRALLRIFEDGLVLDPRTNRHVNGREAIYIMTANSSGEDQARIGFGHASPTTDVRAGLAGTFSAELVNRIDDVIVFRSLDAASVKRIAALKLAELASWVREAHGVDLDIDDSVADWMARQVYRLERGAREVTRFIQTRVREPLVAALLAAAGRCATLRATASDDTLRFEESRTGHAADGN